MGAIRELTKAINVLADSLFGLTTELAIIRKDKAVFHESIDGNDPEVQKALGIQGEKRVDVRHTKERWAFEENRFVNECIRAGMSPSTIQRGLHDLGYDRTLSAVKHKVHDYKVATKPLKL